MTNYRLSEGADTDLKDVFFFGYKNFGERQADLYVDGLHDCFTLLAENPRLGRMADAIGRNVRRHEHGSHVILYEEVEHGITILAVIAAGRVARLGR